MIFKSVNSSVTNIQTKQHINGMFDCVCVVHANSYVAVDHNEIIFSN